MFRPDGSPLSATGASDAFDYYLSTMPPGGWTLSGKAVPAGRGSWTLRWTFGDQSVLLTYSTTPKAKLTVDDCPPEPYC